MIRGSHSEFLIKNVLPQRQDVFHYEYLSVFLTTQSVTAVSLSFT